MVILSWKGRVCACVESRETLSMSLAGAGGPRVRKESLEVCRRLERISLETNRKIRLRNSQLRTIAPSELFWELGVLGRGKAGGELAWQPVRCCLARFE